MEDAEILDCITSVDEALSEIEELLDKKSYSLALKKLKNARSVIAELKDDESAEEGTQDIEMDVMRKLK